MIYQNIIFLMWPKWPSTEIQTGKKNCMAYRYAKTNSPKPKFRPRKTAQKQGFVTLNFNNDSPARQTGVSRGHVTQLHSFIHTLHSIVTPFCPNTERGPVYSLDSHFSHDNKLNLNKSLNHNNLIFNNHTRGTTLVTICINAPQRYATHLRYSMPMTHI